jgi:hypothetical protein
MRCQREIKELAARQRLEALVVPKREVLLATYVGSDCPLLYWFFQSSSERVSLGRLGIYPSSLKIHNQPAPLLTAHYLPTISTNYLQELSPRTITTNYHHELSPRTITTTSAEPLPHPKLRLNRWFRPLNQPGFFQQTAGCELSSCKTNSGKIPDSD